MPKIHGISAKRRAVGPIGDARSIEC